MFRQFFTGISSAPAVLVMWGVEFMLAKKTRILFLTRLSGGILSWQMNNNQNG
jgi:hypothetical protein